MKKLLIAGIVCVVSVFCTGCVKFSYDVQINKKDEISFSETRSVQYLPLQSEVFRKSIEKDLKNIVDKYTKLGCEVSQISDNDGYYGLKISRKGLSFAEVSKTMPKGFKTNENESAFVKSSSLIKKYYKIHVFYNTYDAVTAANLDYQNFKKTSKSFNLYKDSLNKIVISREKSTDPKTGTVFVSTKYADGNVVMSVYNPLTDGDITENQPPQAVLTIKIPVKATKNNASKVLDNNVYQWNLSDMEQPAEIVLEYERYDFFPLIMVLSILAAVGTVLALKRKAESGGPVQGL